MDFLNVFATSVTRCWNKKYQIFLNTKSSNSSFCLKSRYLMLFKIAKKSPNIWATIVRNFDAITFFKFPKLVTLFAIQKNIGWLIVGSPSLCRCQKFLILFRVSIDAFQSIDWMPQIVGALFIGRSVSSVDCMHRRTSRSMVRLSRAHNQKI